MKQVWYIANNEARSGTPVFKNRANAIFCDTESGYPVVVQNDSIFSTYVEALSELAKRIGSQINDLNRKLSSAFAEMAKHAAVEVNQG